MDPAPSTSPPPASAPSRALKGAVFVLVALVGLALLPLGGAILLGVATRAAQSAAAARARMANRSGISAPLDASFASKNGLLIAHYPQDFVCKDVGQGTLMIARNLGGGNEEFVVVMAVHPPVTDDVKELARVSQYAKSQYVEQKGGSIHEVSRADATCVGGNPGLRIDSDYRTSKGMLFSVSSCFAIQGNVGYKFETTIPKTLEIADLPVLDRIRDATELIPPPP